MSDKHTPTPWTVDEFTVEIASKKGTPIRIEAGGTLTSVADVFAYERPDWRVEAEANARLIVRAVNSHAALVEALRDAAKAMDLAWAGLGDRLLAEGPLSKEYHDSVTTRLLAARRAADTALALAEGREP